MPRIVNNTITFFDRNGQIIRDFTVSNEGISRENLRFLSIYAEKDIDQLIYEITLYSIFFNYIDMEEVKKYVNEVCEIKNNIELEELINNHEEDTIDEHHFSDFKSFMAKFVGLYQHIQIKYPNKCAKTKELFSGCTFNKGFSVNVSGSFIEHKFNVVKYSMVNGDSIQYLHDYPLITEYAEKLYKEIEDIDKASTIENKILLLSLSSIYYAQMYKEYKDSEYADKANEVAELLELYSDENKEYANYLEENLVYQVLPQDSMCNNLDKFCDYMILKLIEDAKIHAIEDIKTILYRTDTSKPNYRSIVNDILDVLHNNGYMDEHVALLEMRNKYGDDDIALAFLLYHYTYASTDEYKNLMEKGNGEQRTCE